MSTDIATLRRDIEERDLRDSTRSDSPLTKAPGAVEINTDGLSVEDVVDRIMQLVREA
jgi:cytidylate kinase